jgi:hypothetical protein
VAQLELEIVQRLPHDAELAQVAHALFSELLAVRALGSELVAQAADDGLQLLPVEVAVICHSPSPFCERELLRYRWPMARRMGGKIANDLPLGPLTCSFFDRGGFLDWRDG